MKSILNEIMGGISSLIQYNQNPSQSNPNQPNPANVQPGSFWQPNPDIVGTQLKQAAQLYGWQRQIVNQLTTGQDAFIITESPGGGKTLPVITHWAQNLLGINPTLDATQDPLTVMANLRKLIEHPEQLPQILWLCPIRSLNEQTVRDEFTKDFVEMILQYFNLLFYLNSLYNPNMNQQQFNNINAALYPTLLHMTNIQQQQYAIMSLRDQKNNLIDQYNQTQDNTIKNNIASLIQKLDGELFDLLEDIVRHFVSTKLIGMKYEGQSLSESQMRSLPVIISIYESAGANRANLVKSMPRLQLMIFDEIQTAQVKASGERDLTDERAEQISENINEILSTSQAKRSQLILLSGTQNRRSAEALIHFYNMTYNRRFNNLSMSSARNTATIRLQDFDQLLNNQYVEKLISRLLASKQTRIAFIILNKNRIRQLVSNIVGGAGGSGVIFEPQSRTGVGRQRTPYFQPKDIDVIIGKPRIADIDDPLLRKAAASGIGYMFRIETNDPNYASKDNAIVQELFRKETIRILLTTEYIGSGLNVNVREMYIQSIERGNKQIIPKSHLSQLLNRVGRQPMNCTIYAPVIYMNQIRDALNATNNDFDETKPHIPTLGAKIKYLAGLIRNTF